MENKLEEQAIAQPNTFAFCSDDSTALRICKEGQVSDKKC